MIDFRAFLGRVRLFAITALFASGLASCGGGSAGTGTGEIRTIEGQVTSSAGDPISGAEVTLVQTGERDSTNLEGRFTLATNFEGSSPELLLETDSISTTITVDAPSEQADAISVNVELNNSGSAVVKVSKLQVRAQIVGACDIFFENNRIIRQANRIQDGTVCTAHVQIYGDGRLLSGLPFVIQSSRCDRTDWQTISTSQTGSGPFAGEGEAEFTFYASAANCRYRIVAPFKTKGLDEVIYRIHTFLEEAAKS